MDLTIGIDIGGTKVAGGLVDESGAVLQRTRRPTPSTHPDAIEDVVADIVSELRGDHEITAVGIGAAGFIDIGRAIVLFAPNLVWRNEPLRYEVQRRIGLPVYVENDANAAAWAEAMFGAGRGAADVVALTIGTGIGGGIVLDGRIFRGAFGIGAEMGHLEVVRDGHECGCGQRGCWEQYASGNALVREARTMAAAEPSRAARLLALADGTPESITGPSVTQAAREGDAVALDAFAYIAGWLGHGLVSLVAVLDPAVFVIGGGVSEAGELLVGPTRAAFERRLPAASYRPIAEIRLATLGNDAGLVGAADLARRRD